MFSLRRVRELGARLLVVAFVASLFNVWAIARASFWAGVILIVICFLAGTDGDDNSAG